MEPGTRFSPGVVEVQQSPRGLPPKDIRGAHPALVLQPPVDRWATPAGHVSAHPPVPSGSVAAYPHMHRVTRPPQEVKEAYPSLMLVETEYDYSGDITPSVSHSGPGQGSPYNKTYRDRDTPGSHRTGAMMSSRTTSSAASRANSDPGAGQNLERKRQSQAVQEAQLMQEWGITDPSVITAMMKRNKRLK